MDLALDSKLVGVCWLRYQIRQCIIMKYHYRDSLSDMTILFCVNTITIAVFVTAIIILKPYFNVNTYMRILNLQCNHEWYQGYL